LKSVPCSFQLLLDMVQSADCASGANVSEANLANERNHSACVIQLVIVLVILHWTKNRAHTKDLDHSRQMRASSRLNFTDLEMLQQTRTCIASVAWIEEVYRSHTLVLCYIEGLSRMSYATLPVKSHSWVTVSEKSSFQMLIALVRYLDRNLIIVHLHHPSLQF